MEAVNTDDQPKNSVEQMRKIPEFLFASQFLTKSVSVMSNILASDRSGWCKDLVSSLALHDNMSL